LVEFKLVFEFLLLPQLFLFASARSSLCSPSSRSAQPANFPRVPARLFSRAAHQRPSSPFQPCSQPAASLLHVPLPGGARWSYPTSGRTPSRTLAPRRLRKHTPSCGPRTEAGLHPWPLRAAASPASFSFSPNPNSLVPPPPQNPRRRRRCRSPPAPSLLRRGVVQELRVEVRRPTVPLVAVSLPRPAGKSSPESCSRRRPPQRDACHRRPCPSC
jgi:hypothetical protein